MDIILWPNNILRQPSNLVRTEDIGLFKSFTNDLIQKMYEGNGVGLSAIQTGNNIQLFVIDIGLGPEVYFNPTIEELHGTEEPLLEGCLSVPGFYEKVNRFSLVKGFAQDAEGKTFRFEELPGTPEQHGYRAHVIQHEYEHLEGKIFLDHLSQTKREAARRHMKNVAKK